MSESESPVQRTSKLAIWALVLACLFCIPGLSLVGAVLGIVALVRMSSRPELGGKTLAIISIVAGVFSVFITGVLAAIAIPNFIMFQARAKQAECRANLQAFYTAERAYYQDHDAYSTSMAAIGFEPERQNRYAYFVTTDGPLEDRSGAEVTTGDAVGIGVDTHRYGADAAIDATAVAGYVPLGISGACPQCEVTMACAGRVALGHKLDVWSISTGDRQTPDGGTVPHGELHHEVDGVAR